jgi:hypothetical protein
MKRDISINACFKYYITMINFCIKCKSTEGEVLYLSMRVRRMGTDFTKDITANKILEDK